MIIQVTLLLSFKEKAPEGETPFPMELEDGATVGDALQALSISGSTPKVILVNGRVATPERRLEDGDRLTVFPPVEGG